MQFVRLSATLATKAEFDIHAELIAFILQHLSLDASSDAISLQQDLVDVSSVIALSPRLYRNENLALLEMLIFWRIWIYDCQSRRWMITSSRRLRRWLSGS